VNLAQIRARQQAIRARLLAIEAITEPADDADEATRAAYAALPTEVDTLLGEFDDLETQAAPLAARAVRVDAVRRAALDPANRESGDGAIRARVNTADGAYVRNATSDPYDVDFTRMRQGLIPQAEVANRALDAIEQAERSGRIEHDGAEAASLRLQGRRTTSLATPMSRMSRAYMAAHILRTGSDDYHDAFESYVEDPGGEGQRAALSLTSANGGFLVPFTLDPTIILTNSGSANPFRRISGTRTTATNNWNGVTSAGVNAGWLAEGTEDTDHSPTVGTLQVTPQKASAWVFGSYEILEDSDFAQQFPSLLADAKDRLEEAAFATGTGAGQPFGAVTRATAVPSATVQVYASADIYATQQALPARFRGPMASVNWVANQAVINKSRQFDTAGGSAFWANLGMGQPERLMNAPIWESTTMSGAITTSTAKVLLIGDFNQYLIVDRVGMSVLYEPMVKGVTNARPTGQAGWFAFWRVGADVTTTNAFRVLQIG
jgi:HK97 family phage major capsid protein